MMDIAELIGDKAGPSDGEAALGEDLIVAVVVGMTKNPIVDVRMALDEIFHIDQESIVQAAGCYSALRLRSRSSVKMFPIRLVRKLPGI